MKALFCVQRRGTPNINFDYGACFYDTNAGSTGSVSGLQNFQFRIGGRYYPASPVQCTIDTGSSISNGGCEAFVELAKALNIVGDYRLSTSNNTLRWATPCAITPVLYNENDYEFSMINYDVNGRPIINSENNGATTGTVDGAGNLGSSCFAMATSLETSNGIEISGLNAEEQVNDIL